MHIDWSTLTLQTINVLILVWILARFLFRPVRAIIGKRQAEADAMLADAASAKQQAIESKAAADRARAEIEAQKQKLISEAQSEAAKENGRLLDLAQKDIARLRAEAAAASAREKCAAKEALIAGIKELAVEIARRLVARISPDAGLDGFVDGLCAKLDKLPAETRAAFISDRQAKEGIDVITAAPLSPETSKLLSERLKALLGNDVGLNFGVDPTLIAGIELHGSTVSLGNSFRQDLDQLRKELDFGD